MRLPVVMLATAGALSWLPATAAAQQQQLVVTVVSDDAVRVADTVIPLAEALERLRRRRGEQRGPQPLLSLQKCPKASSEAFKRILDGLQAAKLYLVVVELQDPDPRRCTG